MRPTEPRWCWRRAGTHERRQPCWAASCACASRAGAGCSRSCRRAPSPHDGSTATRPRRSGRRQARGRAATSATDGGRGLGDWRNYPDDEDTVAAWGAWPGVNIGLRACYADSGVVFLDADVTDPAAAGEVTAEIRRTIGRASGSPGGLDALVRIGRAPKALFPVRVRGSLRKLQSTAVLIDGQRCMLEVLAEGQQAVIGGIHPGTGQPYAWPLGGLEDIGPEDLPELTASEIGELVDRVSAILLRYGPAVGRNRSRLLREERGRPRPLEELRARNPELALDAAHFVRNNDWSYDDWVAWAYALRGAFGDEGREALARVLGPERQGPAGHTSRRSGRMSPRPRQRGDLRSGAGTILGIAKDEGWTPPLRVIEGPAPHYQADELEADAASRAAPRASGRFRPGGSGLERRGGASSARHQGRGRARQDHGHA